MPGSVDVGDVHPGRHAWWQWVRKMAQFFAVVGGEEVDDPVSPVDEQSPSFPRGADVYPGSAEGNPAPPGDGDHVDVAPLAAIVATGVGEAIGDPVLSAGSAGIGSFPVAVW